MTTAQTPHLAITEPVNVIATQEAICDHELNDPQNTTLRLLQKLKTTHFKQHRLLQKSHAQKPALFFRNDVRIPLFFAMTQPLNVIATHEAICDHQLNDLQNTMHRLLQKLKTTHFKSTDCFKNPMHKPRYFFKELAGIYPN